MKSSKFVEALPFIAALLVFALAYGAGFALLLLGALAAHGPPLWENVPNGAIVGAFLGAAIGGLFSIVGKRARGRRLRRAVLWVSWAAAGVIPSLTVDASVLGGDPWILPVVMTVATGVAFVFRDFQVTGGSGDIA